MIIDYLIVRETNLADVSKSVKDIMNGNPGMNWQPFGQLCALPDDTAQPTSPQRFVYCQVLVRFGGTGTTPPN